jgi:hypothetical protein
MKRIVLASAFLALGTTLALAAPPTVGEMLKLVPEGAQTVVAVDSAALRSHPKVQAWLLQQHSWTGANEEVTQFLAEAGLDPLRDVDGMVVALLGETHRTRGLVLFAGRYDAASLGAALVKRGATAFTIGTVAAYRLPDSGRHGHAAGVLAIPSNELVIAGEEASVTAALAPPHAVIQLVAKEIASGHVDVRASFWMVATVPPEARAKAREAGDHGEGEGGEPMRGIMLASGAVERVAAQAFLDDALKVSAVAVADTVENAQLIRDAVKGALAAARLATQQKKPELVGVLRNVEVGLSGNEVSVAATIPFSLLEKLATEHKAGAAAVHKHHT